MKNIIALNLRTYPTTIQDARTGEVSVDTITLSKQQLQAAQIVGQSSTELIYRFYNRQGFKVLDISKPEKLTVAVDLGKLAEEREEKAKWNYLHGIGGEAGA